MKGLICERFIKKFDKDTKNHRKENKPEIVGNNPDIDQETVDEKDTIKKENVLGMQTIESSKKTRAWDEAESLSNMDSFENNNLLD